MVLVIPYRNVAAILVDKKVATKRRTRTLDMSGVNLMMRFWWWGYDEVLMTFGFLSYCAQPYLCVNADKQYFRWNGCFAIRCFDVYLWSDRCMEPLCRWLTAHSWPYSLSLLQSDFWSDRLFARDVNVTISPALEKQSDTFIHMTDDTRLPVRVSHDWMNDCNVNPYDSNERLCESHICILSAYLELVLFFKI